MCECGSIIATNMTPWGLLCASCEAMADRDAEIELEIMDARAEEWREEEAS